MRCASTLLLFLTVSAAGQEPNTLKPKDAAEGWILLFDGETTFGWHGAAAKVDKGKLVLSGGGKQPVELRTTAAFGDFELYFEHEGNGAAARGVTLARRKVAPNSLREHHGLLITEEGPRTGWHQSTIRVEGNRLTGRTVFPDGKIGMSKTSFPEALPARSYLCLTADPGATIAVKNVRLRPLNTKSLFNGKDLTGWKIFATKKTTSKWTVTDDGEINVKDGPGDLQTEAKFADFILQLECISNGKHLNSGIFFRCRANEYQNGYEAQIRNQFTKEPTQKYVIDEYDPRTGKPRKREIKSPAVDYGTGAIYRRMPARKEVAKDGEWFTLTVLANGNHFATWVNGVHVVDWTDPRPRSDNARIGCKLEAGHLSIQGHDPTTNLSFRNLRIAEMSAPK